MHANAASMSLGVLHPLGACASGSVALLRGEGARLTVGRAAECSLCLDDKAVSRTHVALFVRGGAAFVQNLRGADFPLFVNGHELLGDHALSHGDLLSLPATHGPDHQLRWQELANEATVAVRIGRASARVAESLTCARPPCSCRATPCAWHWPTRP